MYIRVHSTLASHGGEELSNHVQRRLRFALARLADHIRAVTVQLRDINGPRGGVDKSCTVRVQLVQAPSVVVRDMDYDAVSLIDRVAERAGNATLRSLRRHELHHRATRQLV